MKLDFSKGLVPAVVVDDLTNDVLMLAYVNEEAFEKMLETNETWFYSRSRQCLWNKGATSGNKQIVRSIKIDCDSDTLLVRVDSKGPACHTGEQTCFYQTIKDDEDQTSSIFNKSIYKEIMAEIEDRKQNPVENSYTNYLFDKGIDKIGKKVIEEAGEIVIAAKNKDKKEVISECSDLLYHSFVLLAEQNVSIEEVEAELEKRFSKKSNKKKERRTIEEW